MLRSSVRRKLSFGLALLPLALAAAGRAQAQAVDLALLTAYRLDGELLLDFDARLSLPHAVEDALRRGVPLYFVADAALYRYRWYWRDERVAWVRRSWRVAYQPLTSNWRVGFAGFNQSYATLAEALAAASRSTGWKVADAAQLDAEDRYYLEFSYRLDVSQLPSPMRLGLGNQTEWAIGIERTLRVD